MTRRGLGVSLIPAISTFAEEGRKGEVPSALRAPMNPRAPVDERALNRLVVELWKYMDLFKDGVVSTGQWKDVEKAWARLQRTMD